MDADNFIRTMSASKNEFMTSMATQLMGAIDMNSSDSKSILGIGEDESIKTKFERFLSACIANINQNGTTFILSSNVLLMHHLERRRAAKNRNSVVNAIGRSAKFNGIIRSRNPKIVSTWDLVSNDKHVIKLDSRWSIVGWVAVTRDNIELLSHAVNYILEKGKNLPTGRK